MSSTVSVRKAGLSALGHALYEDEHGQVCCYSSFTCDNCDFGEIVQRDC